MRSSWSLIGALCYTKMMRCSFVAIVSRSGLESLLPECRGAMRLIKQVAENRPAVGLWAVMDGGIAAQITDLLYAGEADCALHTLAFMAEFMGPLPVVCNTRFRGSP